MDKKKSQQMRISDSELSLIKATFAENEELLLIMRKAFFDFPLSQDERAILETHLASEQMMKVMRKMFLPEIQADIPIGQSIDLYMTIEMRDKDPMRAVVDIEVRQKLIEMIEVGLECLLGNIPLEKREIADYKPVIRPEEYIRLSARNSYITHIEQQLLQLKLLSGIKQESVEETKERLKKDSMK
jgi:hypothetical protein